MTGDVVTATAAVCLSQQWDETVADVRAKVKSSHSNSSVSGDPTAKPTEDNETLKCFTRLLSMPPSGCDDCV